LIYLSFMVQHKVRVYTGTGKLVREWGKPGKGDGEFSWPGGIVLGPGPTVYVADQNNHRVQKFTAEGKFLTFSVWSSKVPRPDMASRAFRHRLRITSLSWARLPSTGHRPFA